MNEFKVGDMVERTVDNYCNVCVGDVDVVVFSEGYSIRLEDRGSVHFDAHYFKLHTPAWEPQPGEEVEVSLGGFSKNNKRFFIGRKKNNEYAVEDADGFLTVWPYCRPIQPEIKVTIDGEPFEVSEKLKQEIGDEQTKTDC